MSLDVLIVDKSGNARDWTDFETAVYYHATGKHICDLGHVVKTFTGGKNKDAEISRIDISSIIMASGPVFGKSFYERESKFAERGILYARDCHLCAFCGEKFPEYKLTIDHVHPRSRGGTHLWTNTVTACKPCNHRKADRTPEEANMPLLYVPYVPNMQEKLLLRNRKVLGDQMEYLLARIPKSSRVWRNEEYRIAA